MSASFSVRFEAFLWLLACAMFLVASLGLAAPLAAQDAKTSGTSAAAARSPASPVTQRKVYVGVYVNQINGMSLKDEKVSVDCNIWFRWQGDDLKPLETFDITNGQIDSREDVYQTMIGDYHYATCRIIATIQKLWNVRDFPMDDHEITIEIEDSDQEEYKLIYLADTENCNLSPESRVAGWNLSPIGAFVTSHRTNTNYGDISLPTGHASVWSRFVYSVRMTRPGYGYFGKLFTGLFIAVGIALISLLTKPDQLDSRFALSVGAMFAAVASEYIVTAALPDSNSLTMADKLHVLSFFLIFLVMVESTMSHKIFVSGREVAARWFDIVCCFALASTYVAIILAVVIWRR